MPAVSRKDGVDHIASPDGSAKCCASPSRQFTAAGSTNVFINGTGVVREADKMIVHPYAGPCCATHAPTLSTYSPDVHANGKKIGRIGDDYSAHVLATGSKNVFANG